MNPVTVFIWLSIKYGRNAIFLGGLTQVPVASCMVLKFYVVLGLRIIENVLFLLFIYCTVEQ
jgi:hypothetical protein